MSYLLNNQQRLNDLIFNGRNKEYGAYAIRSAYGNTVFKSLSIVILSFGSFMSLAFYLSNRNNGPEKQSILPLAQDSLVTIIYDLKKEKPAEPQAAEPSDASAARSERPENTLVTVVDSSAAESATVALQQDLVATVTGTPGDGKETGKHPGVGDPDAAISGTVTEEVVETYAVDSEPKYKGGLKALADYLRKNLRYPQAAADAGKGGTIYVKFVVDEKGKVSRVNLLNNLGYGMDEEARRVVSGIPDFESPGTVGGKPVKVYYQLPIRFSQR